VSAPTGAAHLTAGRTFVARPAAGGLHGRIRVPGDKSVSHRVLLLAARAEGRSVIRGLSTGEDVRHTLEAMQRFGIAVERDDTGEVVVEGGAGRLTEPCEPIDVGNSGTGIRLLAGWSAAIEGLTVLFGDDSIARRPMDRVAEPLRSMGAKVDGREGGRLPPLVVRGGRLHGIEYLVPVPSAQVKSAVLLAGLGASGPTTVREEVPTRAHTEELLDLCGARVERRPGAVTVWPSPLRPMDIDVPGDPSQAAFWIVAACITPGSDLTVEGVYVGEGRAGFLEVLRRMGAAVEISDRDDRTSTATVSARFSPLRATDIAGAEVPSLIDEIPVLSVAAAYAQGTTTFAGAAELKVKESDRIATMVAALTAVGASASARPDGLVVDGRGGRPLDGGRVESAGDHRVAMSMAIAALAAAAPVEIDGWDAVATSYPGFDEDYGRCQTR
jgi:3-phosphoshikimate 1-carboxyvinyltransferase